MTGISKWDNVGKASRMKIMSSLIRKYELEDGNFDIAKLSWELSDEICLYIPRVTSMLESNLRLRKYPFRVHTKCLCMFLLTDQGRKLAETSHIIMQTLAMTLDCSVNGEKNVDNQEKDLITALVMLKKVCSLSELLRKALLSLRAMSLISSIQQKMHWSSAIQEASCNLLLDLASVDDNSALALSYVFRKLLNSPQVYTKHSAVRMWTSILYTKSAVTITLDDWEMEAVEQLTRLLLCAPLSYQYDVSELLALLFQNSHNESGLNMSLVAPLLRRVGAVLCLRYTVGGSVIVQPPADWNMKFFSGYVIEAPEILVCSIVTTALKGVHEDSESTSKDFLTKIMRENKLHYLLMAHVLWYMREKDMAEKVANACSVLTSGSRNKNVKLKLALRIKMWILRTSKFRFHTPEIKRASIIMSYAHRFITNKSAEMKVSVQVSEDKRSVPEDLVLTSQENSCLSAIAALQWWVQVDPVASSELMDVFRDLSVQSSVEFIEAWPTKYSADSTFVVDVASTMENILGLIRRQARDESHPPKIFASNGFRVNHISKLLTPGQLVKSVKVALMEALTLEGGDHIALEESLTELSSSVEPSFLLSPSPLRSCNQPSSFDNDQSQVKYKCGNPMDIVPITESASCRKEGDDVLLSVNDDFKSFPSSNDMKSMETVPESVSNSSLKIVIKDAPHRRNSVVVTPRLSKAEIVPPGRVPRWQDDHINHLKGKEHARRMSLVDGRGSPPSKSTRRNTSKLPSSPKEPKASFRFKRSHTDTFSPLKSESGSTDVPPLRGLPPPNLDSELSIVSVHSLIDNFLGDSKSSVSPTKFISNSYDPATLTDRNTFTEKPEIYLSKQQHELDARRGPKCNSAVNPGEASSIKCKKTAPDNNREDEEFRRTAVSEGYSRSRPMTSNKSRPVTSNVKEPAPGIEATSHDLSIHDDKPKLSKPQTFAFQMIKELSDLKGRGDEISPEESERLLYINKTINAILDQESGALNDISSRLESARVVSDDNQSEEVENFRTKDPLTPFYYNVRRRRPQQSNQRVASDSISSESHDCISYKKFATGHCQDMTILYELASEDI